MEQVKQKGSIYRSNQILNAARLLAWSNNYNS